MRLKDLAGWNQTEADWARCLSMQPDGCFLAEKDGVPVGTVVTGIFGPVAWIAMMLVDPAYRRQGIGMALMEHALTFLEERGIRSIRLDATPLGQPLYARLGFVAEYELARHSGILSHAEPVAGVEAAGEEVLDQAARLDRTVTGADRWKLLQRLFQDRPDDFRVVRRNGELLGFMAVRSRARQLLLGPCLATAEAGPLLMADALHRLAGQEVVIDIPMSHEPATRLAVERGLTVQRRLLRMGRGVPVGEQVPLLWASSGPEKG
jgi:hypothetical protein